jgi:hypothetical protein
MKQAKADDREAGRGPRDEPGDAPTRETSDVQAVRLHRERGRDKTGDARRAGRNHGQVGRARRSPGMPRMQGGQAAVAISLIELVF